MDVGANAWRERFERFCLLVKSLDTLSSNTLQLARLVAAARIAAETGERLVLSRLRACNEDVPEPFRELLDGVSCEDLCPAAMWPSFATLAEWAGNTAGQSIADIRYRSIRQIRIDHRFEFGESWLRLARALVRWSAEVTQFTDLSVLRQSLADQTELTSGGASAVADILIALDQLEASASGRRAGLQLRAAELDTDTLTNRVFGLQTSIKAFDAIFTGGLLLADEPGLSSDAALKGRTVLLAGPFGSGKSILSAMLAVEVARKGGAALVLLPEQSPREWRLALEQMSADLDTRSFHIRTLSEFGTDNARPEDGKGVLVLAAPERSTVEELLKGTSLHIASLRGWPLRMIVVDPVDAFMTTADGRDVTASRRSAKLPRNKTYNLFALAKRWGVNLLLTTELERGSVRAQHYIENTADTVIHLGRKTSQAAVTRTLEVTKSRLQRQLPGPNSLLLDEKGLRVYPSFASVRLTQPKLHKPESVCIDYGLRGFSTLLGSKGLRSDDVVVLAGRGRSKTRFGYEFLCPYAESKPADAPGWSLLITERDKHEVRRRIESIFEPSKARRPRYSRFDVWQIRVGYIDAGQVLHDVLEGIETNRKAGRYIDRVMIHSIARWEEGMPLLSESGVFGVELLQVFRERGITSVIISSDSTEYGQTSLRNVMLDYSDVLVEFVSREIRSQARTFVRVLKTGTMDHSRDSMELVQDAEGVRLSDAPLMRIGPNGEVVPREVRFFLFAETERHQKLNEELLHGIKSFLTENVTTSGLYRADLPVLRLGNLSVLDQVQIVQLDEHQTPSRASAGSPIKLHSLPSCLVEEMWADRLIRPERRLLRERDQALAFVPFYLNLSLLLFSPQGMQRLGTADWRTIAESCKDFDPEDWKEKDGRTTEMLFYCPVYEGALETYNCLFFEILKTCRNSEAEDPREPAPECGECRLLRWLSGGPADTAARLFRTICHTGHSRYVAQARSRIDTPGERLVTHGDPLCVITRHWYNTLNQFASRRRDETKDFELRWLPGETTTAGEWYLGVPVTSAAPRTAIEFVRDLTSKEREQRRLEEGVGLPTRAEFYRNNGQRIVQSPFLSMTTLDVPKAYGNAIRRSDFGCYNEVSGSISRHLVWLLEHDGSEAEIMHSLRSDVLVLIGTNRCRTCSSSGLSVT